MSPAYAMELPPGTRLEKYELRKVLGQGGCGISYLAFDCQLEREVVLKEHFPLGLCRRSPGAAEVEATDETSYARSLQAFCREARILAGMRHAGIVAVHEIFAACGTAFLVMDYAEGENLRSWLARHPDARRIRTVLTNLLDALEYTHGSGVIHRDIKPDNIIITRWHSRAHRFRLCHDGSPNPPPHPGGHPGLRRAGTIHRHPIARCPG